MDLKNIRLLHKLFIVCKFGAFSHHAYMRPAQPAKMGVNSLKRINVTTFYVLKDAQNQGPHRDNKMPKTFLKHAHRLYGVRP